MKLYNRLSFDFISKVIWTSTENKRNLIIVFNVDDNNNVQ